jgi:hypothetical protein
MAKVELTLKEYDEIRDKLALYERIVDMITTPIISDEEVEKRNIHGGTMNVYAQVDFTDKAIADIILKNFDDAMENAELNMTTYPENIFLGSVKFEKPTHCVNCGADLKDNCLCTGYSICTDCCPECEDFSDGNCYYYKKHCEKHEAEVKKKAETE